MSNVQNEKPYDALLAVIPEGKENGVTRLSIAQKLHITERKVSELASLARRDSIVLCSDNHGFYFPLTVEEKEATYKRYHSMAISLHTSMKALRKELKDAGRKV